MTNLISKNKRVGFDYEIVDTREVGIILRGFEVKALREGKINIRDAVALIHENELRVHNIDIPLYSKTSFHNVSGYEAKGKRKLLLKRKELGKITSIIKKKGARLLVLEIYFSSKQLVKLKIGLGTRKKKIEKRAAIKEREVRRQMDKEIKKYN